MKIIFGVFDNLDAKLLANKIFDVDTHGAFDSGSVYFISECQGRGISSTNLRNKEISVQAKLKTI